MAVSIRVTDDLPKLQPMFKRLAKLGANAEPLLAKIAFYGESSTRERFSTQKGPDGQRWKPSLRAQIQGGKTLTKDGHLGDSITCLLYTSPSPRDLSTSRMPSSA